MQRYEAFAKDATDIAHWDATRDPSHKHQIQARLKKRLQGWRPTAKPSPSESTEEIPGKHATFLRALDFTTGGVAGDLKFLRKAIVDEQAGRDAARAQKVQGPNVGSGTGAVETHQAPFGAAASPAGWQFSRSGTLSDALSKMLGGHGPSALPGKKNTQPIFPMLPIAGESADKSLHRQDLISFASRMIANPPRQMSKTDNIKVIANTSPNLVEVAHQAGIVISPDAEHFLTGQGVLHIHNNHGPGGKERGQGQPAFTPDIFGRLPDVLSNPDSVSYEGSDGLGYHRFLYSKRVNGHIYYIEELRSPKRSQMAIKTAYVRYSKPGNFSNP